MSKANIAYSEKLQLDRQKEKELITLSWKVKELGDLNETGRCLHSEVIQLSNSIQQGICRWREDNVPKQLSGIRERMVAFITAVTRHQRTPASHVLVLMISSEERNKKPYALPVQCIPYKGLSDSKVRELANKLIYEMVDRNMKVAGEKILMHRDHIMILCVGFTTDGEWNSLRTMGNTRPLSIFQIRSNAQAKYAHMKLQKLAGMITPIRKWL